MPKAAKRKAPQPRKKLPRTHKSIARRRGKASLRKSQQLAREIDLWQKRLAPKLPHIDAHDLHLILWSILRRKYGGERHFLLKRRDGGGYVF